MHNEKKFLARYILIGLCMFGLYSASALAAERSHKKSAAGKNKVYRISAQSALLSNINRGQQLFGKNMNRRVHPASTTKVMTALLVLEHLSLNAIVSVPPAAVNVQPSKIDLVSGEQYKVSDLLYALLLNSANDASVVLAQAVSGSEQAFVKLMNDRARQLGAAHTRFANSNGLPSPRQTQYTTASDMVLIFKEALKHSLFRKIINAQYKTIYSQAGRKVPLKNHNKMLFTRWGDNIYGKTGYTRAARACFVGYTTKGKDILIVAVFGCSRRWDDIRYIMRYYGKTAL